MSAGFDGGGDLHGSPAPESSAPDSLVPGLPDAELPASGTDAFGTPAADAPTAYLAAHAAPVPASTPEDAFGTWRRSRPFWGGLLLLLGGLEITVTEIAPMKVVLHVGLQGLAGYAVPLVMVLCALLLWFSPSQRLFYSVVGVLLSLGSWLTSNLGGFVFGMLLGLVGSSMAFGWTPGHTKKPKQPAPATHATPEAG